jgi:hypothetical protein
MNLKIWTKRDVVKKGPFPAQNVAVRETVCVGVCEQANYDPKLTQAFDTFVQVSLFYR